MTISLFGFSAPSYIFVSIKSQFIKKLATLLAVTAVSVSIFAQDLPKNAKVTVATPTTENVSNIEDSWLPGAVRDRVQSQLQSVTDFTFVAFDTSKINALQRKSESEAYSEEDAIQAGKMNSAKYAVFMVLRKTGDTRCRRISRI